MKALGESEKEQDRREEHIITLEQHVQLPALKHAPSKRIVRRKKVEDQTELFEASSLTTSVRTPVAKNRKKPSTSSSVYFGN